MTELTRKEGLLWNATADEAFERVKFAVTSVPVLALPNFNLPCKIECDASQKVFGAVLMQLKHPIAYFS